MGQTATLFIQLCIGDPCHENKPSPLKYKYILKYKGGGLFNSITIEYNVSLVSEGKEPSYSPKHSVHHE